ncbi:putative leader peptide [Planobispora rosea]|uniref:putative leader peptide n=1 Tax=Planobispora rosea TaxID=35762 RepID=UPI0035A2541B
MRDRSSSPRSAAASARPSGICFTSSNKPVLPTSLVDNAGCRTYGDRVTAAPHLTTRGHVDLCRVASALCPS